MLKKLSHRQGDVEKALQMLGQIVDFDGEAEQPPHDEAVEAAVEAAVDVAADVHDLIRQAKEDAKKSRDKNRLIVPRRGNWLRRCSTSNRRQQQAFVIELVHALQQQVQQNCQHVFHVQYQNRNNQNRNNHITSNQLKKTHRVTFG